jgi:hypothetical protein
VLKRRPVDEMGSQASWSLYRTTNGTFFEIVVGHDGVVEGFRPLTDKQARRRLEVNANYLVEKYFGPMPEARPTPVRFSRSTVIAAIDMMEPFNHAQLTHFLLKLGMNQLIPITAPRVPELVVVAGEHAGMRFLEFFAANIRNPRPQRAYAPERDGCSPRLAAAPASSCPRCCGASESLCDDRPSRDPGRHRHQARQPQLPGDRDHRLSQERRDARKGRGDGEPRLDRTTQLYDRRRDEVERMVI